MNYTTQKGNIPRLHIKADSIPQAYYRAIDEVWNNGIEIRTQYDRKDSKGNFIDPPSRDATISIEITNPWQEPRYPPLSFCEIGTYIAEIMGAKDHLVVSLEKLMKSITTGEELESHEWPYTYHQRLAAYPNTDGSKTNQLEVILNKLIESNYTRRAVATTAIPYLDPFLKEDLPCLREIWLRAPENNIGNLVLNLNASWRSRDLYKAWGDNLIGITFLQSSLARRLEEKTGKKVYIGPYGEVSFSLHIYGQDFSAVGGNQEKGIKSFFDNFKDEQNFINKSMTSEVARDFLVIPQLKGLLKPEKIKEWKFEEPQIALIEGLINDLENEMYLP